MENSYSGKKEPKVISIVATCSGSGKTTLIEKLIPLFKSRGLKVGVLKHDAHKFEIDKKGKDSYRFTAAGADKMIISSSKKLAMVQTFENEMEIEEIIDYFRGTDIVIVEGFKSNSYPKIEVHRKGVDDNLLYTSPGFDQSSFLALASDESLDIGIDLLDLNDEESICNFIERHILGGS